MAEITEQIVREAPQIEAYKLGLLESAKKLSEQQLALPAYQVAGMTDLQKQAAGLAAQGIGEYQPFLQAGQRAIESGIGTLGEAAQRVAGINVAPQYAEAGRAVQAAMATAAQPTQGYDPSRAFGFMNPYQQAVTQQALGEMRRQADIARQGQSAQAVRAGAFGGTREGVQRAEFERGVQDVMSQRAMQDYAQNYAQEQQAAQGAFESQQQRQLSGAGLLGQLGTTYGGLTSQQAGLGLQQAGALAGFGQQYGQLGVQQAALGQSAQQLGLQDVQTLATLGQQEQALAQQQMEAQRATELQRALTPFQQTSFLSDIYKGAPSTQIALTAQTAPQASPLQQAVGLGIGALSAATGAKKAGLF